MPLDDALTLAGQVLADYEAAGPEYAPGTGPVWAGRLAAALRDLAVTVGAWSAAPTSGPSAEALSVAARQIEAGVIRLEVEAARLDRVTAELAAGHAAGPRCRRRRGGGLARLPWRRLAASRAGAR